MKLPHFAFLFFSPYTLSFYIRTVSFIGYILLTKSLPCKCATVTGMP
jgi:hypothetical protein